MTENMDVHSRVAELRRRVLSNEPVSPEELREVIESIRLERQASRAAAGKEKKEKKASAPKVDTDALMKKFMDS